MWTLLEERLFPVEYLTTIRRFAARSLVTIATELLWIVIAMGCEV